MTREREPKKRLIDKLYSGMKNVSPALNSAEQIWDPKSAVRKEVGNKEANDATHPKKQ